MCKTVMDESIIGRAQKKGAVEICYHQIRDYANNKHNRVEDVYKRQESDGYHTI